MQLREIAMPHAALALVILLSFGLFPSTAQSEKRVSDLGLHHPKIVSIRKVYQSVESAIDDGLLKKMERFVDDCSQSFPSGDQRTIYSDKAGKIRKYVLDGGSGDSAFVVRHYYDEKERLRFVFVTGGAVNGTEMELRIYFDENNERIRERKVYRKGPGYPFAGFSDDEGLLSKNPKRSFEAECTKTAPQ